jgi:glycosyltransferase involved in cell wall biosynthesis
VKNISVLISVYKNDNSVYLNEALLSIWDKQIFKPFQVVLIQDGIVSESLRDIISHWRQKLNEKLVFIENTENIGLTKSLNKGLKYCSGDFIARMDSDDISCHDRFKLQIEFFNKNKDIDVLGGSMQEFSQNNELLFVRKYPTSNVEVIRQISISSPLCHPAVMFRRRVFDEGNYYNERYITSQDIDLWFHLILKGYKISNIENIILLFRVNDDLVKRRNITKGINEFRIYIKGIIKLYGFSYRLVYPLIRFFFRLMPDFIIKYVYQSNLRKMLNK